MNKEIPYIAEDNLCIHSLQKEDVEQLRYLYPYPLTDEKLDIFLKELLQDITIGIYEGTSLKGIIQLVKREKDIYEIGYRTMFLEQRNGYMEKGVGLLVKYLEDTNVKRIYARVEKENFASLHILRNNSFLQESYINGVYIYSIEWNRR